MHFGVAKSHILTRAEINPHDTLSGKEHAQILWLSWLFNVAQERAFFLSVLFQKAELEF